VRSPGDDDTVGRVLRCGRSAEFALSLTRFEHGRTTPWHSHAAACLTVPLRGGYEEHTRGGALEASSGILNYKPPGEVHRNRYRGTATTLLVQFDPGAADREQLGLPILRERFAFTSPRVVPLGRELRYELEARDVAPLSVPCLVFELLHLASGARARTRPQAPTGAVALARHWLHACFRESLDLEDLAAASGVTPSYLARAFRAAFGCTLGQYQRQLRVARALEQLRTRQVGLAEVAREAGFSDQSHMNRIFRRHLGLTPGAYRRVRG